MKTKLQEKNDMILIDFPEKTAKEIIDECDNKVEGGKLVYNHTGWYEKQDFYTKEKSRHGKYWVSKELVGLDKNWNKCNDLVKKEGGEMLNFAETLWFLKTYVENFKEYPDNLNWSWTSSRSSNGHLVYVGDFDSDGVRVGYDYPGGSGSYLGVRFSRSDSHVGAKAGQAEADEDEPCDLTLEKRVVELEEFKKKVEGILILK